MPEIGTNTLVKVEHEEVVTMVKYLSEYGLKKCSFKIYQESYSISICHFSILLCRELLNSWWTNSIYHCN